MEFPAIVYFDEADTLLSSSDGNVLHQRTPYFALMHTLSLITKIPIFFIFLSTNSTLQTFAPINAQHPSIRVQESSELIPPLFELPFDTFAYEFTKQAKKEGKLTLSGVCELGQMTKFGRPM